MKKFLLLISAFQLFSLSAFSQVSSVTIDANGNVLNGRIVNFASGKLTVNGVQITGLETDASATTKGVVKLSTAPVSPTNPIAVGDNDPRNTNARTPTAHASTHAVAGSDPVTLAESQITNLTSDLASKEPSITAGTSSQYFRGDKTFQTLNTAAVPESGSLNFTNVRAIASTLTGNAAAAGTITATDSILSAIQKNAGNLAALVLPSSSSATASNWIRSYDATTGLFTKSQPAFTDLSGTAAVTQGGNGLTTATLGDLRYGSGSNTLAILAGNITSTKKFLAQTGTGTVSAAPAWGQPAFGDLTGSVAASQMPALTGDVTTSAGAVATTIANNAVTNAKAAQMAANTVKGNNTGSTANAADLTVSQAQTLLQINSSNKQTTTLGSAAASITFTVPSGYTNLRILFSGRGSDAATVQSLRLRFATGGGSVDTGANYDGERFFEYTTATTLAVSDTGNTYAVLSSVTSAGSPANYSESVEVLVNNYAGTTFYKTWLSRAITRDNTTSSQMMGGGHWKNTGAITSIELSPVAGNFIAGTVATLIAE